MHRVNRSYGFTLIELLVALAIVGVLAALGAPAFNRYFADQRVKSAASEVVNDLQFARMESVQKNQPVTVAFSSSGYNISLGGSTLKAVSFSGGSTVSSGSTMSAQFDPLRATATVTNGPNLTVSNPATPASVRVTLSAMGRVSTCSPSGTMKGFDIC
jgi:type IV fimbrial biogenesis protein FimT